MSRLTLARRALLAAQGAHCCNAPAQTGLPALSAALRNTWSCTPSNSTQLNAGNWSDPAASSNVGSARQLWSSPPSLMSAGLKATLQEELSYEQENRRTPEAVAQGPPAPFTITEAPGDTLITLNRAYGSEHVSVSLHVNNQPSAEFGDEPEAAEEALSTVVFNTQISKGGSSNALMFECETDGTFVAINHISYEPAGGHESPSKYTGPVFDELDEGLQREFQMYLEERGITPALGEYLRHLVHDKEEREYIAWLDNVQKFVGK
uniref:Mitochondrial glycoprotein n=1 Tax=Dunaliella tertiolecta TaxID=3047 RepID=A0A7S3RAG5_DUNTE|mmetsp:Transcript_31971/g.83249  ORF Transcript_31971/g.83249 Transcript_31971/m.83249 type:complete len:264 (-) Transcript_31971:428-1219(-)|eukprot:CAMPEP_0202355670 /NCGR_PEP_ID=MMETSP1126-20121109/10464_1 /ASSEMBLY_ACC=CAM_ASM_000457 /TAXON_ID=3047 /ORGANISM="Dunaliella tertiolecta, Strain CCMP1320" /LENGTH=263 /DNA_ID=CAMNT_0048948317 /DNA_START=36 /DNA_END=827 /DNA_ORIENTATION=+